MTEQTRNARTVFSGKALLAITAWGMSFVVTRVALESFDPLGLVAARMIMGAALLALILRAGGRSVMPRPADRPMTALLGAIFAVHLSIQAYGMQHTTAINAGWIIGFIPAVTAVGSWLLGRERIAGVGWLGLGLGLAGVLLVMAEKPPQFDRARLGDLLQLASCFTWAAYALLAVRPVGASGALSVTAGAMVIAALLTGIPAALAGVTHAPLTLKTALAAGFLGLICSAGAMCIWSSALVEHGPTRIASLQYVQPFITLATGAVVLGEPITMNALSGGACVLLGVWLISSRRPNVAPAPGGPGDFD
ncbi:MAG: DMT family transporter [Planctomycetes bacterium]|nr:DMT family transporter [Planctomycetota bacterium]